MTSRSGDTRALSDANFDVGSISQGEYSCETAPALCIPHSKAGRNNEREGVHRWCSFVFSQVSMPQTHCWSMRTHKWTTLFIRGRRACGTSFTILTYQSESWRAVNDIRDDWDIETIGVLWRRDKNLVAQIHVSLTLSQD